MEHYAGLVLYRIHRVPEFLLLNDSFSNKRHWTPPKGRVIGQENEVKCALRETIDSTGLSAKDLSIVDSENFRVEIKYLSGSRPKRVVYYLAQVLQSGRVVPGGVSGFHFAWAPLQQAQEKCIYKSMQDVLKQAAAYIEEHKSKTVTSSPSNNNSNSSLPLNLQKNYQSGKDARKIGTGGSGESAKNGKEDAGSQSPPRRGILDRTRNSDEVRSRRATDDDLGDDGDRRGDSDRRGRDGYEASSAPSVSGPLAGISPPQGNVDNPLYKTRLCERFETEGFCPYGNRCTFAHGATELRDRPTFGGETSKKRDGPENPLYKTRMCERFMKENFCQYGPRCNFAHCDSELRQRPNFGGENDGSFGNDGEPAPRDRSWDHAREHDKRDKDVWTSVSRHSGETTSAPLSFSSKTMLLQPEKPKQVAGYFSILSESSAGPPTGNESEDREDTRSISPSRKEQKALPVAPSIPSPASSTTGKTKKGAKAKGLLEDDDKKWMKVVEVPNEEISNFVVKKNEAAAAKQIQLEEGLIKDLRTFFYPTGGSSDSAVTTTRELSDQVKELTRLEFRNDLSKSQLFAIIIPALFEEYSTARLEGAIKLLKQFVRSAADQGLLLRAWEKFLQRSSVQMLGKTAAIYKQLYDVDLVEEDVIFEWFDAAPLDQSEVRKKCKPLVDWLRTAEEEDS
ncbi:hypothetical protein BJ742DRAFT_825696 [Cladochytrium replicatum]|nr:hypothetical protein BJ742DRAFT_825696 [Cladochytrium replicatum]